MTTFNKTTNKLKLSPLTIVDDHYGDENKSSLAAQKGLKRPRKASLVLALLLACQCLGSSSEGFSLLGWRTRPRHGRSESHNNNNTTTTSEPAYSVEAGLDGNGTLAALDEHVKMILRPRVSGSRGNLEVRRYIQDALEASNYQVELDEFTDSTPLGPVKFANIVASSRPQACRQLALACHYDSKLQDNFLGATDSAVPCVMLLSLASAFNQFNASSTDLGLMFIFFDGEEAVVEWTATDSLYGSRHLAERWASQLGPLLEPNKQCGSPTATKNSNGLSRLELLMVLDLIGTSDTTFAMYNRRLRHHYQSLQAIERAHLTRQLGSTGLGASSRINAAATFKSRFIPLEFLQDDHVPFMKRGVPILSLLASPFPRVWHTSDDNYAAIDFARTMRILRVLEEFVRDYYAKNN